MIKGSAALLVIDVQHDFIDDDAPVHCVGGKDMLPKDIMLFWARTLPIF